ncbi:phenylalanine--tRNA ligase subunit alpha [Candidatus Uhrbacteria bacterium]|nr:phenylalanine--tRNA ligase subunit alpha [Candidatus Uhrbacteria bacterium]
MKLTDTLAELLKKVKKDIFDVKEYNALMSLEFRILGRKGELAAFVKRIPDIPLDERPQAGQQLNAVKKELEQLFTDKKKVLGLGKKTGTAFDVTLPGTQQPRGHLHLVTAAITEFEALFSQLGFNRRRYPEVEWDYYAFEALNMPKDHPARDEWETFFMSEKPIGDMGRMVLTPHTSSGQVREMKKRSADGQPTRMINISKCYRRQIDISHVPMFHQIEGLAVDKEITMTQLIGVVEYFVKNFFGQDRKVRFRPFHFMFTEPSFEIDVSCGLCAGKGCSYCKDGWCEIAGAGMTHPNVLKAGGYDPDVYSGFAFGFGVERAYTMKSNMNIGDIRQLYSNDIRFLEQF